MLLVSLLAFFSITLLVAGLSFMLMRRRSHSVERLMRERFATIVAGKHANDPDLDILRDQALSAIGPLQRLLVNLRGGGALSRLIEQADVRIKPGTLVLGIAVFFLTGYLIGYAFHPGVIVPLLIAALCGVVPVLIVMHLRSRRYRKFEAQFPDAIDLMSRAIRAGHAFNTGIKMVADDMPDPVGKEFRRVFEEQNYGLPLKHALLNLLDRVDLLDLRMFVVAVLIQRQSGGNLAELLGNIAHMIRERFRVLRQLRVHTAQAKMTGIILMCLPPVMGVITIALNYEYMKIIFEEPLGIRLLIAAAVLQLVGLVWVRKIVNIEV